jgi:hypothetical protein
MRQDPPYVIILLCLSPDDFTPQGIRGRVLPLNELMYKDPGHVQLFGVEIAKIIEWYGTDKIGICTKFIHARPVWMGSTSTVNMLRANMLSCKSNIFYFKNRFVIKKTIFSF